jgi:dTDP-4-amino-4,6-dideoxygalactose transaminase
LSTARMSVITAPVGTAAPQPQEPSSIPAKPFPFLNLKAQHAEIQAEVLAAIDRVLQTQTFILGQEVKAFENEIAALVEVPFAIGCASGSDALLLSLMALGVGPSDEVVTTPFTFVATVGAVVRLGARPIFVDIDPTTFNLDPSLLESALGDRARAVIPIHLFGLPADLAPIMEISNRHNVPVIEDAAQALGARYENQPVGSFGASSCFSFFPSKNLGGAGDGGMITTNDPDLAERLRVLRVHGGKRKYHYDLVGINSRLDSLQAAILKAKLPHLDRWTQARRANAERYQRLFAATALLERVTLPTTPPNSFHVYNQFTIRAERRDELKEFLQHRGIPTEIYYPVPLHLQPAFAYLGYKRGDFPESEAASQEVLSLPIDPSLEGEHQFAVVNAIAEFYSR